MTRKIVSQQMWQIALPAIITNISIPLLGLVDAFIMGHLPDPRYLGAIALGAMIISLLYNSVNFLRMATTGFTAQANGANDSDSIAKIYLRASLLAIIIGTVFIILQKPFAQAIFYLTVADSGVERLASNYFLIRIWGAPFALMNFVAVGWLLGLHKAKEALWIQLFMNLSNIMLNILFVYGFGMDINGVALGTIISEILAALLAFYLISQQSKHLFSCWLSDPKVRIGLFNKSEFIKLIVLNRDIFIRTACLTGSMATFTIIGANMGVAILAANAILMNIQMITSYGLDGFAQAAEVMVGREFGRKSAKGLQNVVILTSKWAMTMAVIFSLFYMLFGDVFIGILTDLPDVRDTAGNYLIWVIILPLISIWSFQLDGIFIGATAGKYMRNGMIISTVFYIGSLTLFIPLWGNHGLWLSYSIFLMVRAITLAIQYPKILLRI